MEVGISIRTLLSAALSNNLQLEKVNNKLIKTEPLPPNHRHPWSFIDTRNLMASKAHSSEE